MRCLVLDYGLCSKGFLMNRTVRYFEQSRNHIFQGICVNIFLQSILTECCKSLRPCGHLLSPFLDTTLDRDWLVRATAARNVRETLCLICVQRCILELHTSCIKTIYYKLPQSIKLGNIGLGCDLTESDSRNFYLLSLADTDPVP